MPGKYYGDLEVGMVIKQRLGRTIIEMENTLFTVVTMNSQAQHLNKDVTKHDTVWSTSCLVNGILTTGLAVGITVSELTEGTLAANLGYDNIKHPHPVLHGDTLYVETEVMEMRSSSSNPNHQPGRRTWFEEDPPDRFFSIKMWLPIIKQPEVISPMPRWWWTDSM